MKTLSKYESLIGQKFNMLIFMGFVGAKHKHRGIIGIFKCDCGQLCKNRISVIVSGHTKSCGCLGVKARFKATFQNLLGNRYGKLIVIDDFGHINNTKNYYWLCQCECGNKIITAGQYLRRSKVKSCGCNKSLNNPKGSIHALWNPNLSPEDRERHKKGSSERDGRFREWSLNIKIRDDYTCQVCKIKGGELNSHHLFNWYKYPDLRYDLNNGVCLCKQCHISFHSEYGIKNNTKEQFDEFYITRKSP